MERCTFRVIGLILTVIPLDLPPVPPFLHGMSPQRDVDPFILLPSMP